MATRYIVAAANATERDQIVQKHPKVAGIIWQEDTQILYIVDETNGVVAAATGSSVGALSLANGKIIVGNGSNVGAAVTPSGDVTLANTGAFTTRASLLRVDEVDLSAAQIITLHSVPVPIVAAPGAGLAAILDFIVWSQTFGSVQFTGGGVVQAQYHTDTTNLLTTTVLDTTIKGNASFYRRFSAATPTNGQIVLANLAIELIAASADFAAGDSTVKVFVGYRIVTL